MILQFYQDHLKSQLQPAQYLLLTLVVHLLQTIKQSKLEILAASLPFPILFESRRRKMQRFLSLPQLSSKEPWYILTSLGDLPSAIEAYKMRFSIEEMFRDFKAGGYNLEGTNVEGQHLCALVLLIAIAYTTAALNGQTIKQMGIHKYVGRVKEPRRVGPRHSHFYIGLYGQT